MSSALHMPTSGSSESIVGLQPTIYLWHAGTYDVRPLASNEKPMPEFQVSRK